MDIKVVHAINAVFTGRNAAVAVRHGELLVTLHQCAGGGNNSPGQDSSEDSADIKHFDLWRKKGSWILSWMQMVERTGRLVGDEN